MQTRLLKSLPRLLSHHHLLDMAMWYLANRRCWMVLRHGNVSFQQEQRDTLRDISCAQSFATEQELLNRLKNSITEFDTSQLVEDPKIKSPLCCQSEWTSVADEKATQSVASKQLCKFQSINDWMVLTSHWQTGTVRSNGCFAYLISLLSHLASSSVKPTYPPATVDVGSYLTTACNIGWRSQALKHELFLPNGVAY